MACRPAARSRLTVAAGGSKTSTSQVGPAALVSTVPESWICHGAPSAGAHRLASVALLDVVGLAVRLALPSGAAPGLLTGPRLGPGSRTHPAAPAAVPRSSTAATSRLPEDSAMRRARLNRMAGLFD